MKKMIEQGLHKTPAGLRLTAWHLPADLDADAVARYRREALEKVDKHGKRILEALNGAKQQRRNLHECIQVLQSCDEDKADRIKHHGGPICFGLRFGYTTVTLTSAQVNMFDETRDLDESQRMVRDLARHLGVAIPDIEAIQELYVRLGMSSGEGVDRKAFHSLFLAITGENISQTNINALWVHADATGDGIVPFENFVEWHMTYCKPPRLSSKAGNAGMEQRMRMTT